MAETINQITIIAQAVLLAIGYPGIFIIVFIENFVGPLPMPPILPISGMLAAKGEMSFLAVWLTAVAGALVGAMGLYAVGAWVDERVIRRLIREHGHKANLSEEQLNRAFGLFQRYGGAAIIIGRTIPVLRNMVSLTAGMSRIPIPRFLFYTTLVSAPTIGVWTYLGFALGKNWTMVLEVLSGIEPIVTALVILVVLLVAVYVAWKWMKSDQTTPIPSEAPPEE